MSGTGNETINVLWTGGLDSTFRICALSRYDVTVQPYYVVESRPSRKYELRAMDRIRALLAEKETTRFTLLPTRCIDVKTLAADPEITAAFNKLQRKYALGGQYDYLARFLKQYGLKAETCALGSCDSKIGRTFSGEAELVLRRYFPDDVPGAEPDMFAYYELDPDASSRDGLLVFENLRIPAATWKRLKTYEYDTLVAWGMEDIAKATWFCHTPVLGMPCGACSPCKDALSEGFAWRVPFHGNLKYLRKVWFFFYFCRHPKKGVRELKRRLSD